MMIKSLLAKAIFIIFSLISFLSYAESLEDYLPEDTRYDTSIPTPRAVLGSEVGHRHYRHDQIVHYLSVLAASSSRAQLLDYGLTNEGRRLVLLLISSDKNMENTDDLAQKSQLLKVWNGFSVHGNESSGANASVLYAYHLIAGHSEKIDKILNETLVIIDPVINPDGYDRFVTDVNSNRGIIDNPDANDIAHKEQYPNGRTNHYWFDLNRDWLLLSQVESQARIKQFQHWQPHVLDDHHEMGSNKSFFFQPGVPERTNPLIPQTNIELTNKLGKFHADILTKKGVSFFTKESYDDFYPGKGSTYPDLQGSVGILFEQASAKAGVLQTSEGIRRLSVGIDNQFKTALSTLYGSFALKHELIKYKKQFFNNALKQAKKEKYSGYLMDFSDNIMTAQKMAGFMTLHNIKVKMLAKDITINSQKFTKNNALYIPIQQKQYTLIKSLFNTDKQFKDNTFYDVSAWNISMAWGFNYTKTKSQPALKDIQWQLKPNTYKSKAIAYGFNWDSGNSPAALNFLLQKDIKTRVISKSFSITNNAKTITFKPGAIIIPIQQGQEKQINTAVANLSEFFQVTTHALTTGLNEKGIDLGSPSISTIEKPQVLMLVGAGVNAYQAGSIWHFFDTQVGMPLTKITKEQLKHIKLFNYTHLILPSGKYKSLSEKTVNAISTWVKQGGHLISFQKSAQWVEQKLQKLQKLDKKETDAKESADKPIKAYADYTKDNAKNTIGGAIISAQADLTHPLGFGMHQKNQYVLIKGNSQLIKAKNPYVTPLKATTNSLVAGYLADEKIALINNSSLLVAQKLGKGTLIKFAFNPTFRGYWFSTQKWLVNAIYFAKMINKTNIN